jgi:hypothetical protein
VGTWKVNASAILYYRLDTFEGYAAAGPSAGKAAAAAAWRPLVAAGTSRALEIGDFAQTNEDYDGEGLLFVPSDVGPLSTLQLEALRDGLEDHSYFELLRTLLARAQVAGVAVSAQDIQACVVEDLLFRELQPEAVVASVGGAFATEPAVLRAKRARVAAAILDVSRRLGLSAIHHGGSQQEQRGPVASRLGKTDDLDQPPARHLQYASFYDMLPEDVPLVANTTNLYQAPAWVPGWANQVFRTTGITSMLNLELLLFARSTPTSPYSLRSNWTTIVEQRAPAWGEMLRNGTLMGFTPGDELVAQKCLPVSALLEVVNLLRAKFPRGSAILWYNEAANFADLPLRDNCGVDHTDFAVPAALDWFSTDNNGLPPHLIPVNATRTLYESKLYPMLSPIQRTVLVPGAYGSTTPLAGCNESCFDDWFAKGAEAYYEWAKQDARVAAIMPFAWTTDGPPIELGAKNLAKTRAAYARIGSEIVAGGRGPWAAGVESEHGL